MHEPSGPHDPDGRVTTALLTACPSHRDSWLRLETEWPAEGRGVYIDAGAFAGYLVAMLERDETDEFASVFQAVEVLLKDPDESVRYVTKVGLLEDVGNIASNSRVLAVCREIPCLVRAGYLTGVG